MTYFAYMHHITDTWEGAMAEFVEGYIDHIIYRNDDNGYTVLSLHTDDDEITCVGTFAFISEGEFISAQGSYTDHMVYGQQFLISSYELKQPSDIHSIERYLSSGAIRV